MTDIAPEIANEPPRVVECEHCNGLGWYETDQKIESGNDWDEPYHWEWATAECPYCAGTGWAAP